MAVDIPHSNFLLRIHGFEKELQIDQSDRSHRTDQTDLVPATKQHGTLRAKYRAVCLSGDHIGKVLPVPIPNTAVKLSEPMIVHTSVKVGIAGFFKPSR